MLLKRAENEIINLHKEKIMGTQSRRDFLKFSAVTTGALAIGATRLSAASGKDALSIARNQPFLHERGIAASKNPAFPNVLPKPGAVKKVVDTDVVVIGAGFAGMCAAVSAAEAGAKVVVLEKFRKPGARGGHISAFGSDFQDRNNITKDIPANQIVRELVRWGQGRIDESILRLYVEKSGDCMDWLEKTVAPKGVKNGQWFQGFKGPDYYEYPTTHLFKDSKGVPGNVPLVNALVEVAKERGAEVIFRAQALEILKDGNKATGVLAKTRAGTVQYNAKNGVIIATGDYASNHEMVSYYSQTSALADAQIYFPSKSNTGDGHMMAIAAGGAMQKDANHAAVIHLEAGAKSYNFLHVNKYGKRFKNEDVNTQSKSCGKLYQPDGIAWSIYDAKGLEEAQEMLNNNLAGGLFFGQQDKQVGQAWSMDDEKHLLEKHIAEGKVVVADTIEQLADKMGVPKDNLVKTVKRYNEIVKMGRDVDFGKRKDILRPITTPPFYGGKLLATLLTMCGGLNTDSSLLVLDDKDEPIEQLYVVGSTAGNFFAGDYPTICPGIGHGRCMTFGRLAGLKAAGKSFDDVKTKMQLG